MSADLTNWRTAPYNQWAFQHIDAIMPVGRISASDGPPLPLPTGAPALNDLVLQTHQGPISLTDALAATATDAMIVLKDGAVVFEAYAHGMTAQTPHILMSSTKAVIGILAGILQHRDLLDLEAEVCRYVPEISDTAYAGATVRNLLDMRTGVLLDEAEAGDYAGAGGWDPPAPDDPPGLHAFLSDLKAPHRPHGGPFSYISSNTDLLGWVMERATGKSVADLLSEHLWKPMGAAHPASITLAPDGAPRCTGGLSATAHDFARLGQLVLDGGAREGVEVIPSTVIEDIVNGGDAEAWAKGEWGQAFGFISPNMRYRSGWYMVDDEPRVMFAMGIHGQNLFVDRTRRIVIAKFSSQAQRIDYRALPLTHLMEKQIRLALAG
jgi:CubicO group peptidase (beta-lactamase class C family)